ncbi:FAD-dependent oxidoreductase [Nocardioides hungaricus]
MRAGTAPLRLAVVGSGPAGMYVTDALTRSAGATVDMFERLPTPFGLLRYGVAPDHLKIKGLAPSLQKILDRDGVRFFGNVEVGADVSVPDLLADYHGVVLAVGAPSDARLGIPGETLPGCLAAREVVSWYNGHPDAGHVPDLRVESAAVIGLGNVALDVARILVGGAQRLVLTDATDDVLEALSASRVRDVHIVGRRGPSDARFTYPELRELGSIPDVDVVVRPVDVADGPETEDRRLTLFRTWAETPPSGASRRIHFHFNSTPLAVLGTNAVDGLRLGSTDAQVVDLPVGLVVRAVGYRGKRIRDTPFDDGPGRIPTREHRVIEDGEPVRGLFACGWAKRGPNGVLGTNRADAAATAAAVLEDLALLQARPVTPGVVAARLLADHDVVEMDGWTKIDAREQEIGAGRGARRIKLASWRSLLSTAREDDAHRS